MSFALPNDGPSEDTDPHQFYALLHNIIKPVVMTSFSGLDTFELMHEMARIITIVISPSSIQQGARLADWAAIFLMGDLVEFDTGASIFTRPKDQRTDDYVTGRFG